MADPGVRLQSILGDYFSYQAILIKVGLQRVLVVLLKRANFFRGHPSIGFAYTRKVRKKSSFAFEFCLLKFL